MSVKAILSHLNGKEVDAFYALLIASGRYTFLPELYDVFGRDLTIKFLEVFAGSIIKVPSVKKLEDIGRNTTIYMKLARRKGQNRKMLIKQLSEEYDMEEATIAHIYEDVRKILEDDFGYQVVRYV